MNLNFKSNKNDNFNKIINAAIINHSNGNFKLASNYYKKYLKKNLMILKQTLIMDPYYFIPTTI